MSRRIIQEPTKVQTLIFSRDEWTLRAAHSWLREHAFKARKVDITERSYRFRQRDPSEFKRGSFRTITLSDGVKAVIGHEKIRSAHAVVRG